MSHASLQPRVLFKTLTNTELGAESVEAGPDGSIVFHGVLKQVTEAMLTSYPRSALGTWTPNRAAVRYGRDQIAQRGVRDFASGRALDPDAIRALAR